MSFEKFTGLSLNIFTRADLKYFLEKKYFISEIQPFLTYLLVRLLETMYLKVYLLAQILEQSKNLKNTFEGFIKRQRNPAT